MTRDLTLWTGVLAGPVMWFAAFEASYALSATNCTWKTAPMLVFGVALAIVAASCIVSFAAWQRLRRDTDPASERHIESARALAAAGIVLNALFFLVLVAQALPHFILGGCEQ